MISARQISVALKATLKTIAIVVVAYVAMVAGLQFCIWVAVWAVGSTRGFVWRFAAFGAAWTVLLAALWAVAVVALRATKWTARRLGWLGLIDWLDRLDPLDPLGLSKM